MTIIFINLEIFFIAWRQFNQDKQMKGRQKRDLKILGTLYQSSMKTFLPAIFYCYQLNTF